MRSYIDRLLTDKIIKRMDQVPVTAIIGPRQCGKSTLAHHLLSHISGHLILDMERPSDIRALTDPEAFFNINRDRLICIDEIQRKPDLFPVIRTSVDSNQRNGQFLILGSASPDLLRQSSETLAGRISYLELTPFVYPEIVDNNDTGQMRKLWLRGGYPRAYLAKDGAESYRWRVDFIQTFLQRDIPTLGFRISDESIRRLWTMCAHLNGQVLNQSKLGESLGISHNTVRSYIEILQQAFMVRIVPPWVSNVKKRLVKSPKLYFRDSGLLHTLLEIEEQNQLFSHPVYGSSWESFALENILASIDEKWKVSFYRTEKGSELDIILERGMNRIGLEFKSSTSPSVSRGFWNAVANIQPEITWIVAPVERRYPLSGRQNVFVGSPHHVCRDINRTSAD